MKHPLPGLPIFHLIFAGAKTTAPEHGTTNHYNMFKLKSILLSVLLLTGFTAFAQQITVTGVVTSSTDGYGVIGAAVMEKGTSNGCVTDLDGNFSLKVEAGKILEISCIGYRTIDVVAAPQLAELAGKCRAVGFGTPSYFSKCYMELFGRLPGEEREDFQRKNL